MRVTKLIREYVEKQVSERMPNPAKPVDAVQDEYDVLVAQLEKQCRDAIKDFAKKHGGKFYFAFSGYDADRVDAMVAFVDSRCDLRYPSLHSVASDEYDKQCKAMRNKRAKTINDILVSLELGANRAELEEMLSKIG